MFEITLEDKTKLLDRMIEKVCSKNNIKSLSRIERVDDFVFLFFEVKDDRDALKNILSEFKCIGTSDLSLD